MNADISAIILAAGFSSRMGRFKPLLPLGNKSVLAHAVEIFRRAQIDDIRVVIGHRAMEVRSLVETMGAEVIENPQYKAGMLSSVKAGVNSLPERQQAFFVLPVDIPLVRHQSVSDLVHAWGKGEKQILYPTFLDQRGHPPLISTLLADKILAWNGAGGLRAFLSHYEHHAAEVPVADEYGNVDMDTPGDYQKILDSLQTYDIPSSRECMAMMTRRFVIKKPILDHCRAVARVAVHLTRALNSAGCRIDPKLVNASGLLHDLLRTEPDHAQAAAQVLTRMGYAKVADVVASHMNIHVQDGAPFQAREVVYLADKLVQGDRPVSLHQRFNGKRKKFAGNPEANAMVNTRFEAAMKIKDRFENRTGKSLDTVLAELVYSASESRLHDFSA